MAKKQKDKDTKKKRGIIARIFRFLFVLVITVILLAAIAVGVMWVVMPNNMQAALYFLQYGRQDIEDKIEENDTRYDDVLGELGISWDSIYAEIDKQTSSQVDPDDSTDAPDIPEDPEIADTPEVTDKPDVPDNPDTPDVNDEKNEISTPGIGTPDSSVDDPVTPPPVIEQPGNDPVTEVTPPPSSETTQPTVDSATYVAKMYMLKTKFTGELAELEKKIKGEYASLPKEQRTPAARKEIAGRYIKTVLALESQCDAEVEAVLSELATVLEAAGKDTTIVETLRTAYKEEKSLKKAYYMDIYTNGLKKG